MAARTLAVCCRLDIGVKCDSLVTGFRRLQWDRCIVRFPITTCFFACSHRETSHAPDQAQFSHRGYSARRHLPDKGKLTVRWGRNATGQATDLTAGLPKEGELARWEMVVFRNIGGLLCSQQEMSAKLARAAGFARSCCPL